MLPYLSIIGIFLSIILLYFNAKRYPATIYLGIFFFSISMYALNQYVLLFSGSVLLVGIFATNITFLYYLTGPMLYLYTRSVLTDNPRLRKTDILHFIPLLIYLVAVMPYLFSPWSYKLEIAAAIVKDVAFLGQYKATVLSQIFSNTMVYLSRPVLIFAYTLLSIGMFVRFIIQRKLAMVLSHQFFITKWLTVLLGFQLILIFSYFLAIYITFVDSSDVFFTVNFLQILSGIGLTGLLLLPFFFPGILYGLPRMPDSILKQNTDAETRYQQSPAECKKNALSFESEYIELIGNKTESCMMGFQPYLKPDFNMAQLAVHLDIPAHHLAYFFREVKKQSFNDYRNEWRINYAKNLISSGKASELTLEAIGLQSGFVTRNTFLTAFKRTEGVSPRVFAAQATA